MVATEDEEDGEEETEDHDWIRLAWDGDPMELGWVWQTGRLSGSPSTVEAVTVILGLLPFFFLSDTGVFNLVLLGNLLLVPGDDGDVVVQAFGVHNPNGVDETRQLNDAENVFRFVFVFLLLLEVFLGQVSAHRACRSSNLPFVLPGNSKERGHGCTAGGAHPTEAKMAAYLLRGAVLWVVLLLLL